MKPMEATKYSNAKRPDRDVSARRRRMQEKGKIPWTLVAPAIIVLVIILGVIYAESSKGPSTIMTTSPGNYNFPFACEGQGSLYMHIHPWLRIVINGQNITVPADIGLTSSCTEPVHTHDASGIIHIESETNSNFTLGDFFNIWGTTFANAVINNTKDPIVFNSTDILGFKTDKTHSLSLVVDGTESNAYGSLVLNTLDYCNAANSVAQSSPCYATAQGNPYFGGPNGYQFGTGHTILIEYK
ncbi:MAG: hypothetical protein OK439_02540 [Thaumarchaeota archaeon]|nr:hypothetical protein [Nitrososphaerota archaeon]